VDSEQCTTLCCALLLIAQAKAFAGRIPKKWVTDNWYTRMMALYLWYFIITLLGLLTFPLAYRLLPALADRGYALSRALGWLLWGYIFWLLGSLGVLQNNVGGELFVLLILAAVGFWSLRRVGWAEIKAWFGAQRRLVLTVELLFLAAFAGWSAVRAANPDIVGTEKPMELAFINAILRSPALPPFDPWLSGYAISYYYFGYVLVAMLAKLAGTTGGVAFNLGGSLVFALSAVGSYGLLYNLLHDRGLQTADGRYQTVVRRPPSAVFRPLLAPFFLLIVSNLGGLLHLLRLGGIFWRTDTSGALTSPLWAWLDMGSFSDPPPAEPFPHWWWWQASRVIQDFDFNWVNKGDIIDEFPFFSYLLADLHPHVLAMPFAFLAMTMAFGLFLDRGDEKLPWPRLTLSPAFFLVSAVILGGIVFLNTWDAPFYVALFAGAYVLRRWRLDVGRWTLVSLSRDFVVAGLTLGISGILLYLPFYLGFSSQAGGPLPNVIYVTRGIYLWIMFAPLLTPILIFVIYLWRGQAEAKREGLKRGLQITLGLVLILWLVSLAISGIIASLPLFSSIAPEAAASARAFLGSLAAPGWGALLEEGFIRRLTAPGALLTLAALLTFTLANLWPRRQEDFGDGEISPSPLLPRSLPSSQTYALLLTLTAGLLVLVPEFIYLRDLFGYRINTIFKFYFLAWLMWGIVAAYAVVVLWTGLSSAWRVVFRAGMIVLLGLSLIYPVLGLWTKTDGFDPPRWTLDGTAYLHSSSPDEAAAMAWLREAPLGVAAEAVGGSYTTFARMATHSGQPTVLGWEFHEVQWRGGSELLGTRKADIARLYCIPNWDEARQVLDLYDIRYVVVGVRERSEYAAGSSSCPAGLSETKFILNLPVVFQQGDVTIYEVSLQD